MKSQIIQALHAFLFLAARISTGNETLWYHVLGKEGNIMDTRCHRTTTTLSLPSLPSSNLAHSFNRGKKADQYQSAWPRSPVRRNLYSMRFMPEHRKRKKVASKESAESSFPSHTLCTTMSITVPRSTRVSFWNLVRFEIRRTKEEIFCFEAGRKIGKRSRSRKW